MCIGTQRQHVPIGFCIALACSSSVFLGCLFDSSRNEGSFFRLPGYLTFSLLVFATDLKCSSTFLDIISSKIHNFRQVSVISRKTISTQEESTSVLDSYVSNLILSKSCWPRWSWSEWLRVKLKISLWSPITEKYAWIDIYLICSGSSVFVSAFAVNSVDVCSVSSSPRRPRVINTRRKSKP